MFSLLIFQESVDLDSFYAAVQPLEVRGSLLCLTVTAEDVKL